jgi:hypothetical protein
VNLCSAVAHLPHAAHIRTIRDRPVQTAVATGPVRIRRQTGIMLALGLTGAAGAGMILIAPGRPEIGWMVIAAAVGGAMSLICRHSRERR